MIWKIKFNFKSFFSEDRKQTAGKTRKTNRRIGFRDGIFSGRAAFVFHPVKNDSFLPETVDISGGP